MTYTRYGVNEFKKLIGADTLDVVRNPNTEKLFVAAGNGKNYKCQGDLNTNEGVEFLVVDGELDEACLINKGRGASVVLSL